MPRKKSFTVEWALDKALEVFAERGYHRTSMAAIVTHLKLSRSSVYLAFHTKQQLFVRAMQQQQARSSSGWEELSGPGSPRAKLVRIFEVAAGGREALPPVLRLLIEAALGLTHREPEIARLVDETFEDLEGGFRAAIERGQAAAEIAERVDPEAAARVLLSLYVGLFLITGHDAAGERLGAVLQQVEALLPAPART